MINAERLLGGLIRNSLRGSRRSRRRRRRSRSILGSLMGGGVGTVAGLGALGVAMAAYEHYTKKQNPTSPPRPAGGPPPPPTTAKPPPPPPAAAAKPPAGPGEARARLLIRAMIAAANADGEIDPQEREAILLQLDEDGMSDEERRLVESEMAAPVSIDTLLPRIHTPELANQVYAVSLAAIAVDNQAERAYLEYLRSRLGLDPQVVNDLHAEFGIAEE